MNIHHLELFYYVARFEGIVAACRQMPYGIQQPAVSAQVAALEKDLGVLLFERRPFRLTAAGKTLYEFAAPFFGRLAEIEDRVQGRIRPIIRLAGLTQIMREHVPELLARVQEKFPALSLTLKEIDQHGAEDLITRGEADLAVSVLEARLPAGFRSVTLATLPTCLIVGRESPIKRVADLWKSAKKPPLISLPPHELLPRVFQKELGKRGLTWKTDMEVSSQDLVSIYVRKGLGLGLAVQTPDIQDDSELRILPLLGFPSLPIGAFWRGQLSEPAEHFVQELSARSKIVLQGGK